ncbi:MAG: glycine betaine ABC transporter substrate-binding protein, partial [Ilumatobacteraceae bacterium]
VTVVGTGSAESMLLSDIYARALEGSGFRVARRAAVADLAAGYAALTSGAADLFVTRTGDLLAYVAENEPAAASTSTTEVATTTTTTPDSSNPVTSTTTEATTTETSTTEATTTEATTTGTGATGDATSTTALEESTTTTISTAGQAAAISLNLQSNLIGEILPATLQIGATSSAEDKPVIACRTDVSTGISLLTDLAVAAPGLRIAGTEDFRSGDPFGLVGFEKTYGAEFAEFVPVPVEEIAAAFIPPAAADDTTSTSSTTAGSSDQSTTTTVAAPVETDADCGAFLSSLDPMITAEMVVIDDNLNWVGNNGVLPLMTVTGYTPGVAQVVDQVSQALTTPDLREMIRQVADGAAPSTVAGRWLQLTGITGS